MRNKKGFTLLEVLITIVITFLMVGIIYGSWKTVFGTMKGSRKIFSDYQTASLLLRRMSEEIASAFVSSDLPFHGEKEELKFFTTKNSGRSDLAEVSYFLRSSEEEGIPPLTTNHADFSRNLESPNLHLTHSQTFLLRRESVPLSETTGRAFSLAPIEQISFQYFDGEEWSFSWDSETKLPHSVAILLKLEEGISSSALIPVESS